MPKPKRTLHTLSDLTTSPPTTLPATHTLAQVVKPSGNNLYLVHFPQHLPPHHTTPAAPVLVELAPQFRSQIWLRRGGYVVVDTAPFEEEGEQFKIKGVIVNVVREEKGWRKQNWWPKEFAKQDPWGGGSGEESEDGEAAGDGWDRIRYSDDEGDDDDAAEEGKEGKGK